jgi:Family of unknown function (DUF6463)
MAAYVSWSLLILGAAHVLYGFVKFRAPLVAGVSAGFVGQFGSPEIRRTAFWFVAFGPLLMMGGHVCVHAAAMGDDETIKIVGIYLLVVSCAGIAALPKSPFVVGLLLSALLVCVGLRII